MFEKYDMNYCINQLYIKSHDKIFDITDIRQLK